MSKAQKWTVIFLSFIVIICTVVGGYAYSISNELSEAFLAPGISTDININGDMLIEYNNNQPEVKYIRINNVNGKVNSRLIDILLMLYAE